MKRIALIVNPASGVGRAARLAGGIAGLLRQRADVTVLSGGSADESAELVAHAARDTDAVVVLGGDGIVHIAIQALAGTDVPLGIIPAGTGNDCAAAVGLPADPQAAAQAVLDALDTGSTRTVDLGRTDTGRWWFTVLCAGFDSAVNERGNRMRWPRGPRRYDLAIAIEMWRLAPRPFTISLDGGDSREVSATLVAIGNTPIYGGGKRMTPHADLSDGRFGITVVGPVSRLTLARLAPTLPRAGHIGHPAVATFDARTVAIDAPGTLAYADGERLGPLPATTTCIADALRVLVPAAS